MLKKAEKEKKGRNKERKSVLPLQINIRRRLSEEGGIRNDGLVEIPRGFKICAGHIHCCLLELLYYIRAWGGS